MRLYAQCGVLAPSTPILPGATTVKNTLLHASAALLALGLAPAAVQAQAGPAAEPLSYAQAEQLLLTRSDRLAAAAREVESARLRREAMQGLGGPSVAVTGTALRYSANADISLDPARQALSDAIGLLPPPLAGAVGQVPQLPSSLSLQRQGHRASANFSLLWPLYIGGLGDAVRGELDAMAEEAEADASAATLSQQALLAQRYFGAQLAAGSSDFRFSEPEIQRMFSDYVHNCVVGDIMLNNKYSIGDLMNSTDPYALIFSKPSPLRGLYDKNRNFLTCEQASTKINTDSSDISGRNMFPFLQQVLNRMHGFTNQVFGPTNGASTALFTEMLGDSYNYFHGNSMTSTEIIRKNVVMNGLRSGLESFSAQNGDTAGLVNTATQTSMAKMRLSQATSASIAANTLPVMHSVLLGMTMALFPVLIVLAVVSSLDRKSVV